MSRTSNIARFKAAVIASRSGKREAGQRGRVLATRFHHVLKRTPTDVRRAVAYVLLNARKHYAERRPALRRFDEVSLRETSNAPVRARWFDGWKGRSPPPFGRYADARRRCEVAAARTWLLAKGWRRAGLVDPAEVPGRRRGPRRPSVPSGSG